MRVWRMRSGISITLSDSERQRLDVIVADRNAPQSTSGARIVLLSSDGFGPNAIISATSKVKTCVWLWQERFATEGVDGLLRDKTRPPGKPSIAPSGWKRSCAARGSLRRMTRRIGRSGRWGRSPRPFRASGNPTARPRIVGASSTVEGSGLRQETAQCGRSLCRSSVSRVHYARSPSPRSVAGCRSFCRLRRTEFFSTLLKHYLLKIVISPFSNADSSKTSVY